MSAPPDAPDPSPWADPSRDRPGPGLGRHAVGQLTRVLTYATFTVALLALAEPVLRWIVQRTTRDADTPTATGPEAAHGFGAGTGSDARVELGPHGERLPGIPGLDGAKVATLRRPTVLRDRADAQGGIVTRAEGGAVVRLVKVVDGFALVVLDGPRGSVFGWVPEADVATR